MKKLKLLYIIPVFIALIVASLFVLNVFPPEWQLKVTIAIAIPLLVLGIGFRLITRQRIQIIRNQLYQILQTLEEFDVDEPSKVAFEESPFPIFNELNEYLIELIDRIRGNFQANKQFTQNASHELQTPLAIIKGHVELLLQSPNIGQKEVESLAVVLQNTNRLSRLNSALVLLSKIEHQRFGDTEVVDFSIIAEEALQNFKDLIQIQEIEIKKDYTAIFSAEMSITLAEILITNLLQNAIRYNEEEAGEIYIRMDTEQLSISNPGKELKVSPLQLFKRFKRESDVEESLGLGLSIVKKICEQSDLTIDYTFQNSWHTLTIKKGVSNVE